MRLVAMVNTPDGRWGPAETAQRGWPCCTAMPPAVSHQGTERPCTEP